MEEFLKKYYIIFFVIAGLMVFALIGYFVDKKKKQSKVYKITQESEDLSDINFDANVSLKDAVNKNFNMNGGINMNTTESNGGTEKLWCKFRFASFYF